MVIHRKLEQKVHNGYAKQGIIGISIYILWYQDLERNIYRLDLLPIQ